eukprot:1034637_1
MCLSCCACCCNPSASVSLLNEANQQLNLRDLMFSKEESTVDERTYRSIVLVAGYVRRFDVPKDMVSLFHQYYFDVALDDAVRIANGGTGVVRYIGTGP